ncbi:phytase [Mangrovibacterium marinum]|uniref:3-phytase n=1 Tax=Mangrovibacterium marinum TaxID=1639118 RepID=A0A2T5C1W9_9BACT|nr:phytase [Mangrovibacterium marinum]PTN08674.1 3-phytase [Mangrovibacterium marinum]
MKPFVLTYQLLGLATVLTISFSCQRASEGSAEKAKKITLTTTALFETTPMPQPVSEDAADDPAIWVNPNDSTDACIIGTDKKGGLAVYNLQGAQLHYYPDGNMNNVDVRSGFVLNRDTIDLVCATNRSSQSLSIYKISAGGQLTNIAARLIHTTMKGEVYGFALYKSPSSQTIFAYMNSKEGEVEQWELFASGTMIDAKPVRSFNLNTQVEGMIADDQNGLLFVGAENDGIWKFDAEPDASTKGTKLAQSSEADNENIAYDLEGLSIYYLPDGQGYLLASSQGNYSYAVYERKAPHNYLGSFRITDGKVDGVEETDGIDLFSTYLNADFKHGLLVVQDGYNNEEGKAAAQNFKLIPWENVADLLSLKRN